MAEDNSDYAPDDADAAFTQSDNHALGDTALEPFTSERFVAAQGMGMLWPGVVAQGPKDTLLYKGQATDASILFWLCSIPIKSTDPKIWTVRRARREPDDALEEALRWADERGITKPNSKEFWAAMKKFVDILLEINASYSAPGDARPN